MDIHKLSKIELPLAAWRKHVAEVGVCLGRINELNTRCNAGQLAMSEAKDVAEIKTQFVAMAEVMDDAERLFRELELAASASKVAARNTAHQIKKATK